MEQLKSKQIFRLYYFLLQMILDDMERRENLDELIEATKFINGSFRENTLSVVQAKELLQTFKQLYPGKEREIGSYIEKDLCRI